MIAFSQTSQLRQEKDFLPLPGFLSSHSLGVPRRSGGGRDNGGSVLQYGENTDLDTIQNKQEQTCLNCGTQNATA